MTDDQSARPPDRLFATEQFRKAQPPGDTVQPFDGVLREYEMGWLQIPLHQREPDAWDTIKRQAYVARLRESARGSHPPGCFVTYQLTSPEGSPVYLNDGYQRLMTLVDLKTDPAAYDMDADGVRNLLYLQVSVQHRNYPSHEDAMKDFQLINNGTRLTPWELCSGFLKYMPNYDQQWRRLLDGVQRAVTESEARLRTTAQRQRRREADHKLKRHTLALFHRYLTAERKNIHYQDVPAENVHRYVTNGSVIERRLAAELVRVGYDTAALKLARFEKFIPAETAELEVAVQDVLGLGSGLSPISHRWLLDLAVWRHNNGKTVSRDMYGQFVKEFLRRTRGQSIWMPPEGSDANAKPVTLALSHLGLLPKLADLARMPDLCRPQRRRRRSRLRPGYDNSHIEPFLSNGEGPTFPEPSPTNRARGAQPVER